jgi:hypothetical protein
VGGSVGVAVGVDVGVGEGVAVGVGVGVLVGVGVFVGVPVGVTVGVGVGIKNVTTWPARRSISGLIRSKPKTITATSSAIPANSKYLPSGHRGNGAGSRSAPQLGQTR